MRRYYEVKLQAHKFRETNGYSCSEAINLKSLLIKLNILSVFKKLSDNFSGMAIKSNDICFMLINSGNTIGRQNFTISHEIYHLFIQEDFNSRICQTQTFDKTDLNEYKADLFAANFLMPEEGIFELIPQNELIKNKIQLDTLLRIEQYFSCSRSALLSRLISFDLIDKNYSEQFKENKIKNARLYGYDTALYQSGNDGLVIGDYGNLAKKLFDKEKISESNYASLMLDIGVDIDSEEFFKDESNQTDDTA